MGDVGDGGVCAHEDGDVLLADALGDEVADGLCDMQECELLIVVAAWQQTDVDIATRLALGGYLLFDVGIGAL